jgi:homoserine dehydrogenase
MAEHGISLESIVQRHDEPKPAKSKDESSAGPAQVVIITYQTTEQAVSEALDAIEKDGHIAGQPNMIRIERL